jgi:hypothetical protein
MLNNYVPSYDFKLFTVPWISPLQAQEYGAETTFRANTPLPFVDYSLSVLQGLLDPKQTAAPFTQQTFFQNPQSTPQYEAEVQAEKARQLYEEAKRRAESYNIFGGRGPIVGEKELKNVDDAGMAKSKAGEELKKWFDALPAGSGVFLIAVAVVILLLLFVRR